MTKRHKWVEGEHGNKACADCGMTRHRVEVRKRCGYYGRRLVDSTIYRNRKGAQVWTPSLGNKVPGPCRPPNNPDDLPEPCTTCGTRYGHARDCVTLPLRRMKLHELRELYREASAGEEPTGLDREQLVAAIIEEPPR